MAKRTRSQTTADRETLRKAREAVGLHDLAEPEPTDDPLSVLNKTAPVASEFIALEHAGHDPWPHMETRTPEMNKRCGLRARMVVEEILADGLPPGASFDQKLKYGKFALDTMSVMEGSKHDIAWKEELAKRPKALTEVAFNDEILRRSESIVRKATRKRELDAANIALRKIAQERLDNEDDDERPN